ncbi:hypothetical protein CHS0354_013153 [Potamilus streckersoni]|uniref:Uncharacterized protein n=1 Tax=Potamilus streckersoni TaxID=2493646 RepID=A0AAE0T938_9BIVA|nr:hypothetical protein CHS0354_013153 [Potamilus streckersoni]
MSSSKLYHPCHKLSVPSAKIFWCRHCMQMFEDAISRWRHSRICRGSSGVGVQGKQNKDRNGQVVQMYIKPDAIPYTAALLPGQKPQHKRLVKQTRADLKCMICNRRFMTISDMREHVKYPCTKLYEGLNGVSEELNQFEPVLEIKRAKVDTNHPEEKKSALSLLAAASKHVESLAVSGRIGYNGTSVNNTTGEAFVTTRSEPFQYTVAVPQNSIQKVLTHFHNHQLTTSATETDSNSIQEGFVNLASPNRENPDSESAPQSENTIIVIEEQEGPLSSFYKAQDPEQAAILDYVRQTALQLPPGEIIQVLLKENVVQHFITGGPEGIRPLELPAFKEEVVDFDSETVVLESVSEPSQGSNQETVASEVVYNECVGNHQGLELSIEPESVASLSTGFPFEVAQVEGASFIQVQPIELEATSHTVIPE